MIKQFLKEITPGQKISIIGGLILFICTFLPFMEVSTFVYTPAKCLSEISFGDHIYENFLSTIIVMPHLFGLIVVFIAVYLTIKEQAKRFTITIIFLYAFFCMLMFSTEFFYFVVACHYPIHPIYLVFLTWPIFAFVFSVIIIIKKYIHKIKILLIEFIGTTYCLFWFVFTMKSPVCRAMYGVWVSLFACILILSGIYLEYRRIKSETPNYIP